jgi:hypothetical protein
MTAVARALVAVEVPHLVLVMDQQFGAVELSRLTTQLAEFKRRFGLSVTGVAGGLWALGPAGLTSVLAARVFDNLYFAGDPGFVIADAVNAARRSGKSVNLFLDAAQLLRRPVQALRLLVELQGLALDAAWLPVLGAIYCRQDRLDLLPSAVVGEEWVNWSQRAWAQLKAECTLHCTLGAVWTEGEAAFQPSSLVAAPGPAELYLTYHGLRRFGGLARLQALPLRFGRLPVGEHDSVHALTNAQTDVPNQYFTDAGLALLPGWMPIDSVEGELCSYVLDIVPAPVPIDAGERLAGAFGGVDIGPEWVTLPRQLLQVRRVPFRPGQEGAARLVFMTSNFDKAKFVSAGLYAMAMQSHSQVEVCFTDDCSSDESVAVAKRFATLLVDAEAFLRIGVNETNRGTYWIRNECIHRTADPEALFLVNDSDDVSSLQRGWLQAQWLAKDQQSSGCFLDIVRVDASYQLMRLDAEIERYGTASLAMRGALVDEIGYFENIKRNADTEFIERTRLLKGKLALPWHRYPCLFQVFDGGNLTADIYELKPGTNHIVANHSARAEHTMLFRRQHQGLQAKAAKRQYAFPESSVGGDYGTLGSHFLIDGYGGPDDLAVITTASDGICRKLAARAATVVQVDPSAARTSRSQAALFVERHKIFSTDLGAGVALAYLLGPMKFSGYFLLANDSSWLDALTGPGDLFRALEEPVLLAKRSGDLNAVVLGGVQAARTWPRAEGYTMEWLMARANDGAVLLHSSRLT